MNHFDGTIHLGDVMTFVAVVAGLYLKSRKDKEYFKQIQNQANDLHIEFQTKVNIMYTWFEKHVLNGQTNKGD